MFVGATPAVGAVPVPFSVTDCVPGVASSFACSVAVRAPVAVGLNVTPITQVPFVAATTRPFAQFVPVAATIAKSPAFVPVMVTAFEAASVTDVPPVLLKVTVVVALVVLILWFANATGEGASVTFAAVPVPVTVKLTAPEVPPPVPEFVTVTGNTPAEARSLVRSAAIT
jgi:hypothetical protein